MESIKKPPLGIMPKRIWLEIRFTEVDNAIERYNAKKLEYPKEWADEWHELYDKLWNQIN